jgi:hypothetical protein
MIEKNAKLDKEIGSLQLRVEECIAILEFDQKYSGLVLDMRNDAGSIQEILAKRHGVNSVLNS